MTEAQQRSLSEILADMKSGAHMNRLLQGDVGSGKTVIASLAMYGAYTVGLQSALMVPTEILAEQHYQSLQGLFPAPFSYLCWTSTYFHTKTSPSFQTNMLMPVMIRMTLRTIPKRFALMRR